MKVHDIPPGFIPLRPPLKHLQPLNRIAWSPDGHILAAASYNQSIRLWEAQTSRDLSSLRGHVGAVYSVAWSPDGSMLASGAQDATIRLWETRTWRTIQVLKGHSSDVYSVAWSANGDFLASGSKDGTLRLWNTQTGQQQTIPLEYTNEPINDVTWSPMGTVLAYSSTDRTRIWDADKERYLATLTQGVSPVPPTTALQTYALAWAPDGSILATGSADRTIRLWNPQEGRQIRTLEGHKGVVTSLSFSSDSRFLASKSRDKTVCLWRTDTWRLVTALKESTLVNARHAGLAFHPTMSILATLGEDDLVIRLWDLDEDVLLNATLDPSSIYYTNAKIALVGDSGVGKSSLGMVLAHQPFAVTESTHGRKVWLFDKQVVELGDGHKEIHETLIWDLAGQPGYRLIHQLHLGEVVVALVVFDPRSETDPFAGIHHWANALRVAQRAQGSSAPPMKRFLVAARKDRHGRSASFSRIEMLMQELDLDEYFEVSAKENLNIETLVNAIKRAIEWERLPKATSNDLFQRIRDFLIVEQEAGRVLTRMEDLYRAFLRHEGVLANTEDLEAQFGTCIILVEAKGLIRRFSFGDLVLLQPEWLDAYASALVNEARDEPDGLGSIPEARVRAGAFSLPQRLPDKSQEQLLLIAMIEDLLRYEIALREEGDLVFPFQSTRENLDLPKLREQQKAVIFSFEGPVLHIYATLAVRLSRSGFFIKKDLWKNAITYTTKVGGTYGLFLDNTGQGCADLILFFDEEAGEETNLHFEEFVREHLQRRALAETVQCCRVFVCPECKTPVTDLQVARRRERGFDWIGCGVCETIIELSDRKERLAPALSPQVQKMNETANEQRELDAAQLRLLGKIATEDFDVFLCHNHKEKLAVKKIGEQLKERGILPWLDEWQLRPGFPWQRLLGEQIGKIKSAAVFVGNDGIGPWQSEELESFLHQFVNRQCPVMPVLLSDVPQDMQLKLPAFLENRTWIDFRKLDPDPMKQLIWGITGEHDA